MEKLLEIKKLNKSYNGIPALTDVDLSIAPGEIHGLVGANGSGKSTLMNILFGSPVIHETGGYQGEILFQGRRINLINCAEVIGKGIGMVHQEFALIPGMTIGENIKLSRENTYHLTDRLFGKKYSLINRNQDHLTTAQALRKLGIDIDPGIKIVNLSTNLKQFVEIAREIARSDLQLLLLDEPTAVLNQNDAHKLMEILTEMAAAGIGILFVSHRLEEIQHICDTVTVLRDGKKVSQYEKADMTINSLARDMIGHLVNKANAEKREPILQPLITYHNFSVKMPGEEIKDLNLNIFKGEILGLTSLSGHGKLALGYGMMGLYPAEGMVTYEDAEISKMEARSNILKGMYVLPDDRQDLGILPEHSLEDNIIFTGNQIKNMFARNSFWDFLGFVDRKKAKQHVSQMIDDFDIKCSSGNQRVRELSGGNQQKVCLARALTVNPRLLFVAEPTRGIDISAKEKILQMLIDINRSVKTTIVIASSELDELKRVCDRIAIIVEGKLFKILSPDSSDLEFGLALSGEEGAACAEI